MRRLFLTVLMAPLLASSAYGWGCEGHQIVALIARTHLSPAVSAAVDDLLRSNPIDPAITRFCQYPNDLMVDSATWADDTKNQEKTSVWHYIDIPRSADKVTSVEPWCPPIGPSVDGKPRPGCVTNAIEYEVGILRDKSRPSAERATALRYVIHFLGDIHQPLHDEDDDDQGGNCTAMRFFSEDRPANLHAIWDYKLIQHKLETEKLTQVQYAASLNDRFAAQYPAIAAAKADDPIAWAWQAHAIAVSNTYGNLDPAIPAAAPGATAACNAHRDTVTALHIVIGDAYFNKAIPVIDEQLATGGFRLAVLLNDVLR